MLNVNDKLVKEYTVNSNMTALAIGSGDLEVLATPTLAGFMENAAKELASRILDKESTTVGTQINMQHLAPSKVGATIKIEVVVSKIEGRMLSFEINAFDQNRLVAAMSHQRCIVNIERFMSKLK